MRLSMRGGVIATAQPAECRPADHDEQGKEASQLDAQEQGGRVAGDACSAAAAGNLPEERRIAITAVALAAGSPAVPTTAEALDDSKKRVHFNIASNTVHEITPYAEIYGEHPRTFVFDRDSCRIAAAPGGFVSLQALHEEDDEDSDDESLDDA
jgi:hypothetical protein